MIVLEALIEFVVFLIDCAIFLFWHGDQFRSASLLDQSPLERRARRRLAGLGCVIMLVLVTVAVAVFMMVK